MGELEIWDSVFTLLSETGRVKYEDLAEYDRSVVEESMEEMEGNDWVNREDTCWVAGDQFDELCRVASDDA